MHRAYHIISHIYTMEAVMIQGLELVYVCEHEE